MVRSKRGLCNFNLAICIGKKTILILFHFNNYKTMFDLLHPILCNSFIGSEYVTYANLTFFMNCLVVLIIDLLNQTLHEAGSRPNITMVS